MRNIKNNIKKNTKKSPIATLLSVIVIIAFVFFFEPSSDTVVDIFGEDTGNLINAVVDIVGDNSGSLHSATLADVPEWDGETAYVVINNNEPNFSEADKTRTDAFEIYSELDSLGRCGVAYANICKELMPTEDRDEIGSVTPSGWKYNGKSNNNKYDKTLVDGQYIYNRCHLIGFQLAGENANKLNLVTGTRYLNIEGMLPFENLIDDYVDETNNHVLFRVTPIYEGNNPVCSGVQMEAWSVEDNGDGICFNVYAYNAQPGIEIDYSTGENWLA